MTINIFMFLFTIGAAASSLLTQAMKKAFTEVSSNILAAGDALIVGVGGTIAAYIILDIEFNAKNVVCIPLMALCVWVGSMISYDKVLQTIRQVKGGI